MSLGRYGKTARPWGSVVEFYRSLAAENEVFTDIAALAEQLASSPFPKAGLSALTSMHDLILGPTEQVLDNPHLVIKPDFDNHRFVLEYRDGSAVPWARAVPFEEGYATVVHVLTKHARWYREVLPTTNTNRDLGRANKIRYELDGNDFSTLEEFAQHFSRIVLRDYDWRGNLDAFNDILRGGFGTPEGGFVLVWRNHSLSKTRLGHREMLRFLEGVRRTCHPSNIADVESELAAAREGMGPTMFDLLVEIIREHGEDGSESEDGVELVLT